MNVEHRAKLASIGALVALAAFTNGCKNPDEVKEKRTEPVATAETHSGVTTIHPGDAVPGAVDATQKFADADADTAAKPTEFDGTMTVRVPGRANDEVRYTMKDNKVRVGLTNPSDPNAGMDLIVNGDSKKATILLNDKKEYVEVDLAKLANEAKARAARVELVKTGQWSDVAGKKCELWEVRDPKYVVTACVAKGAPYVNLEAALDMANIQAPPWITQVLSEGYFPLSVKLAERSGRELVSTKVNEATTNPSKEALDQAFEVPQGYTKVDTKKLAADRALPALGATVAPTNPKAAKAKANAEKAPPSEP